MVQIRQTPAPGETGDSLDIGAGRRFFNEPNHISDRSTLIRFLGLLDCQSAAKPQYSAQASAQFDAVGARHVVNAGSSSTNLLIQIALSAGHSADST
jgi:hypothetical protein